MTVLFSVGGRAPRRAADGPFSRVIFRARFYFYLLVLLLLLSDPQFRVREKLTGTGYDRFRVWLRQIEGVDGTKSGYGYDKFRVGYDRFRVWLRQIQGQAIHARR